MLLHAQPWDIFGQDLQKVTKRNEESMAKNGPQQAPPKIFR